MDEIIFGPRQDLVTAIKKPGEDIIFNPSSYVTIEIGDTILVLGDKDAISRFEVNYL